MNAESNAASRGHEARVTRLCAGIDTCSDRLALALVVGDCGDARSGVRLDGARIIGEREIDARNAHCEALFPLLVELLEQSGRDVSEISLIGVTAGPGRFTSLRIGLATAQGLALGLDARVVPVSVFEAASVALADEHPNGLVAIVLDAGPDLHWAVCRAGDAAHALLAGPALAPPADVARDLFAFAAAAAAPLAIAGSGAARVVASWPAGAPALSTLVLPNLARAAAFLALARFEGAIDPAELEPLYLRPTRAEEIRDNAHARSPQN
ncbi:MAG: tRNA (adenosine(37)-N6)-threonylcarbamoyltransferase complex dimerization subunit type 1 TsaB [bacterium]